MRDGKIELQSLTMRQVWLHRMKHHLDEITGLNPIIEEDDCTLKSHFGAGESSLGSSLACS